MKMHNLIFIFCITCILNSCSHISTPNTADDPSPLPTSSLRGILEKDNQIFRDVITNLSDSELQSILSTYKEMSKPATRTLTKEALISLNQEEKIELFDRLAPKIFESLREAHDKIIELCKNRTPRIHTIGTRNILIFTKQSSVNEDTWDKTRGLRLVIEGRDLHPECVDIGVGISGNSFLDSDDGLTKESEDYIEVTRQKNDRAILLLKQAFLNEITSGEQLEIHVAVGQKEGIVSNTNRVVTYASRKLTLYEKEDYKEKVDQAKVPIHDFQAFPLPDEKILHLYGPLIRDNYFVVDLTVRNRNDVAKLISTGMIVASGRALVQAAINFDEEEDEVSRSPLFTVPVSVVPTSARQMYTVLDDEEVEQPRAKFFRGLQFVGAIASAVTTAYSGISANQAANLFTGVVIPATGEALPDRWPGFKRNLVEYSMPDLIKIPANSVSGTGHYHLFFSKKKIDTLISDQTLYNRAYLRDDFNLTITPFFDLLSLIYLPGAGAFDFRKFPSSIANYGKPQVKVISLEFDNLEIPFEEVFDTGELDLNELFRELQVEVPRQIDRLAAIQKNWNQETAEKTFGVSALTLSESEELAKKLQTIADITLGGTPSSELQGLHSSFKALRDIANSLIPGNTAYSVSKDLFNTGTHSLEALKENTEDLERFSTIKLARSDRGPTFKNKVKSIEQSLKTSASVLNWYTDVTQRLYEISVVIPKVTTLDEAWLKQQLLKDGIGNKVQGKLNRINITRSQVLTMANNKISLMDNIKWGDIK